MRVWLIDMQSRGSNPGGPAMTRPSPEQLVEFWNLRTMPTENVRFWQSYVDDKIGPDGKPLCSAIVALLVDDPSVFSDMHRLPTDEIWHFYLGDPIELLLLHPDGSDELVILGQDVLAGQRVQTVVPAGAYMGARLQPGGEFVVYGNTMAFFLMIPRPPGSTLFPYTTLPKNPFFAC